MLFALILKVSLTVHSKLWARPESRHHLTLLSKQSNQIAKQDIRIAELETRVKWFEKQVFGRKSERRLSEESRFVQLMLGSVIEEEKTPPQEETVKGYQITKLHTRNCQKLIVFNDGGKYYCLW